MGRKKKHEEHENLERWLVSYADFITLLFATFTALYAISTADLAKLKDVAQSIRDGFQQQSLMSGIESLFRGQSPPSENANPLSKEQGKGEGLLGKHDSLIQTKGNTKASQEQSQMNILQKVIEEINLGLEEKLKALASGPGGQGAGKDQGKEQPRQVELSMQERGIRVSFDSSLLFDSGNASLKELSKESLDKIAKELHSLSSTHFIHIEGHTDSDPIASAIFPSNWELSTARASAVVRYLIQRHKFEDNHMAAVGYGDSRPIASNTTPEGKRKNRRIDIIIYSKPAGDMVDVRKQFMTETMLIRTEDRDLKRNQTKIPILTPQPEAVKDTPVITPPKKRPNTVFSEDSVPENQQLDRTGVPRAVDISPDIDPMAPRYR
jgi:chemotaxis protein MotB